MTQFTHYGLFFTEEHLQRAQKNKDKAPFKAAWEFLSSPHEDAHSETLLNGYRYRLGDMQAGEKAYQGVINWLENQADYHDLSDIRLALLMGQTLELIRPYEDSTALIRQWADRAQQHLTSDDDNRPHAQLVKAVLQMAIGIITENEAVVNAVCDIYRDTINHLHPEGYITHIVENNNESTNFDYQMQATQSLALLAEMAKHIGIDLYSYNKRGVSVTTACAYPLYYYFYPEKWRWSGDPKRASEGIEEYKAKMIFKNHIGFIEIIAEHYKPPLKAIQMILDDVRPCLDPFGGGLTTLTHAPAPRRGLFG
ncbi:MAG: alginate lyase family protein [Anaerolineae bacterium]|nr:alginate lyase family protein [Anaerolineae bacterium]